MPCAAARKTQVVQSFSNNAAAEEAVTLAPEAATLAVELAVKQSSGQWVRRRARR
jgi:hypothetical protein